MATDDEVREKAQEVSRGLMSVAAAHDRAVEDYGDSVEANMLCLRLAVDLSDMAERCAQGHAAFAGIPFELALAAIHHDRNTRDDREDD